MLAYVLLWQMVEEETPADEDDPDKQLHLADWKDASPVEAGRDLVLKCLHHSPLTQLSFHSKGDYVAVLSPTDPTHKRGVVIHIISQRKSVNPFKKMKEPALAVCPHSPLGKDKGWGRTGGGGGMTWPILLRSNTKVWTRPMQNGIMQILSKPLTGSGRLQDLCMQLCGNIRQNPEDKPGPATLVPQTPSKRRAHHRPRP